MLTAYLKGNKYSAPLISLIQLKYALKINRAVDLMKEMIMGRHMPLSLKVEPIDDGQDTGLTLVTKLIYSRSCLVT